MRLYSVYVTIPKFDKTGSFLRIRFEGVSGRILLVSKSTVSVAASQAQNPFVGDIRPIVPLVTQGLVSTIGPYPIGFDLLSVTDAFAHNGQYPKNTSP